MKKKDHNNPVKKTRDPQKTVTSTPRKQKDSLWAILLFCLAFALYANSIPNGYVLDDNSVVKNNYLVHEGFHGMTKILETPYRYGARGTLDDLYRPFSLLMFAAEWQISPWNPVLNHTVNVLFYAINCVLLFFLLRRIFRSQPFWLALFATLLWLAHPIHTEVVSNIKSRDEIMSVFFLFLALLGFIRFLTGKKILMLVLSVISYTASFLSKEGVITCLFIFPLFGWYITGKFRGRTLYASACMIIPAIIYLMMRQYALRNYPIPPLPPVSVADNLLVAAPNLAIRLATTIFLLGKYLLLLLVPLQLVSDYSYNQIPLTGWTNPLVIVTFLVYAGMLCYAILKIRSRAVPVFAILFFLVTLSIYSNLFMLIGSSFAERFLFLPSVGFCLLIAWLLLQLYELSGKEQQKSHPRKRIHPWKVVSLSILGIFLVFFTSKTVTRNVEWKSEESLFSADIKRSPNSAHMHYYWGLTLRNKCDDFKDQSESREMRLRAIGEFKKAMSIYPVYPECYEQLGMAYLQLDDRGEALKYYQQAEKLNPYNAITYGNMGMILFKKGELNGAMKCFRKAISLFPTYDDAWFNMGSTYGMLGQLNKTIECYEKCISINPSYAKAYLYLGKTYELMDRPEEGKKYFEKAYELDPSLK